MEQGRLLMITCKDSVRFSILRYEIISIFEKLFSVFKQFGYPVIVTCGTEAHGPDDPHTHGLALDLRSKHIQTDIAKEEIADTLRRTLGSIYTVLLENKGKDNEHFHIQIRKDLWRTML
jgi:hypothetical protein